ncbi:hypothetical protein M430DRAFT_46746 [Amorphotheca resinae ATCC 22711]|uniref:Uncharacterized protein n=1 Tax=Amorphotheca resinae ATCC 22711 TaxID=857342 RepID=A0A2T3BE60_AMORE|nr:hypothetical protein M430DRAFT_46746 [Amorphotheca resinae ATCC 22711]PSS27675.1 hypothetical protein M430DRAFT_46746 [Amorphotheca resinae ATCC 22711]
MDSVWLLLPALFLCVFGLYSSRGDPYRRMSAGGVRKLPGPWSLPIVGRVRDIPTETTWLHFYGWSKEFGP